MTRVSKSPKIRKAEILEAADLLFHEKGYHETAVSDIVRSVNVAQGTFYYHFASKEAVLEGIIGGQVALMGERVRRVADSPELAPPRQIEAVFDAVLESLYRGDRLMFDFLYTDEYLHIVDRCARLADRLLSPMITEVIEEGNRTGVFDAPHPNESVVFVASMLDCLVHSLYQKCSEEQLSVRFDIASKALDKVLGLPDGTVHLRLPVLA